MDQDNLSFSFEFLEFLVFVGKKKEESPSTIPAVKFVLWNSMVFLIVVLALTNPKYLVMVVC